MALGDETVVLPPTLSDKGRSSWGTAQLMFTGGESGGVVAITGVVTVSERFALRGPFTLVLCHFAPVTNTLSPWTGN